MAMRIYTKTGDKGSTSLIGGTKVPKSHLRIESYGTVDELNSFVGLLGDQLSLAGSFTEDLPVLRNVQDRLFTIGSSLACDPEKEPKLKIPDLKEEDIELNAAPATRLHMLDFLGAIKDGHKPVADIEQGHISTASCILANMSMKIGRPIVYDPKERKIINDVEANSLIQRPYRQPWLHPDLLKVRFLIDPGK